MSRDRSSFVRLHRLLHIHGSNNKVDDDDDADDVPQESLEAMLEAILGKDSEFEFYKEFIDTPPRRPKKTPSVDAPLVQDSSDESSTESVLSDREPPPVGPGGVDPGPCDGGDATPDTYLDRVRGLLVSLGLYEVGKWVYRAVGRARLGAITMPLHWSSFYLCVKCARHPNCGFGVPCPKGDRYIALYGAALRFLATDCNNATHADAVTALKAEFAPPAIAIAKK